MREIEAYMDDVNRCTRCGNCQYYCPSFNAQRTEPLLARGRLQLIKGYLNKDLEDISDLFIKRMNQCVMCGNCSEFCPAGINIEEIIEYVKNICVTEKGPSDNLGHTKDNVSSVGSITGDTPENRLLWLKNIEDKITDIKMCKPAEYAYLTGCVPALYPSSYSITQSFVQILQKAGLDFTLLGDKENCCGYPLVIGGLYEEAKSVAEKNVKMLNNLGVKKVITTCPSCYHMWKHYYPKLLGYTPESELIHETQLILKLIKEGKLKFTKLNKVVTYHDPCDLGRKSGEYEIPRDIINSIPGLQLIEMKHIREDARCCGGGGNLEMHDSELGNKIAQERIRQAVDTGAKILVTACQQCKRTLIGGARKMRGRIKVIDISELVLQALE